MRATTCSLLAPGSGVIGARLVHAVISNKLESKIDKEDNASHKLLKTLR